MNHRPHPGDRVQVVDGTFVGMRGVVVDSAEAETIWQRIGGQEPPLNSEPRIVLVILPIFAATA